MQGIRTFLYCYIICSKIWPNCDFRFVEFTNRGILDLAKMKCWWKFNLFSYFYKNSTVEFYFSKYFYWWIGSVSFQLVFILFISFFLCVSILILGCKFKKVSCKSYKNIFMKFYSVINKKLFSWKYITDTECILSWWTFKYFINFW